MKWILYNPLILCCLAVTQNAAVNIRLREEDEYEGPIICNGEKATSYIGTTEPLPWNAAISVKVINHVICLGSIIPDRPCNFTFTILTSGKCFSWQILDKLMSFVLKVHFETDKVGLFISGGMSSGIRKITFINKDRVISTRLTRPAILLLKRPVVFNDKAYPICTASSDLKLHDGELCYTSAYGDGKITTQAMKIVGKDHCEKQDVKLKRESGFCAMHEKQSKDLFLGAPLVCIKSGKAYQVGLYQQQLNGHGNATMMSFFRHVVDVTLQTHKHRWQLHSKSPNGAQEKYLSSNPSPQSQGRLKRREIFKKRAKQALHKLSERKRTRKAIRRKQRTGNSSQREAR